MTTTVTGTKEVGAGAYSLTDFTSIIGGTLVKVGAVAARNIVIADGVIDGADRVVDMTSGGGNLDGLTIQRVKATGLRRGLVRFRSAQNILIEDVIAEGRTPPGDYYPTGVATSDLPTKSLTIRRCVFRGFVGKPGSSYTNGDGFAQEELSTNTLLEDVVCEGNADGGFDLKGQVVGSRMRGSGNHRNLRLWGAFDVADFTSENPRNAHIWLGGGSRLQGGTITRPTFIGGSSKPHLKFDSKSGPAHLILVDPVFPAGETLRVDKEGGSQVTYEVRYTTPGGLVATLPAAPNLSGQPTPAPAPAPSPAPAPAPAPKPSPAPEPSPTPEPTPAPSPAEPTPPPAPQEPAQASITLAEAQARVQELTGQIDAVLGSVTAPGGTGQLEQATALLARIADLSDHARGGSSDKTAQIAALHALAVTPV